MGVTENEQDASNVNQPRPGDSAMRLMLGAAPFLSRVNISRRSFYGKFYEQAACCIKATVEGWSVPTMSLTEPQPS